MNDTCPHCGCELPDGKEHSDPLRRMFFASIRDIWQTLPDEIAPQYPSSESLRKAALCRAGWCDSVVMTCGDEKTAMKVAALVKHLDRYAIVDLSGTVVTTFTAKSISKRACKKDDLSRVVEGALMWAHGLVGADASKGGMAA